MLVEAVIFVYTIETDQDRYDRASRGCHICIYHPNRPKVGMIVLVGLSYLCIPSKQTKVGMIVLVGAVIFVYTIQTDQGRYDRASRGCHICVYHRNRPR